MYKPAPSDEIESGEPLAKVIVLSSTDKLPTFRVTASPNTVKLPATTKSFPLTDNALFNDDV